MKINNNNIEDYLNKFFEGETCRDEEKEISRFFLENHSLPQHLSKYKEMFEWIESGMPETELSHSRKNSSKIRKYLLWSSSVAAVILMAFFLALKTDNFSLPRDSRYVYDGSFVCHGKVKNKNLKEIMPEIKSTLQEIENMHEEVRNLHIETQDLLYDF